MIRIVHLLLFSIAGLTGTAQELVVHVSPGGSDQNAGTEHSPLASLAGARDRIRELRMVQSFTGITVQVAAGDYFLDEPLVFGPEDAGSADCPIRYVGMGAKKPVLSGGVPVTGFEPVAGGQWRSVMTGADRWAPRPEQCYVNGRRAVPARIPDKGFFQPKGVEETVILQGEERTAEFAVQKIRLDEESSAVFDRLTPAELGNMLLVFYHKWDNTRKRITRYSAQEKAIYISGRGMKPWNKLDSNTLFFIEHIRSGLDTPGEWTMVDEEVYYHPLPGEVLEQTQIILPRLEQLVLFSGRPDNPVKHIQIENLAFYHTGYRTPSEGNEPMQAAAAVPATVMADYAEHITLLDCVVSHTGNNAIWFRAGCSDNTVQRCLLTDLGAGGIKIGEITPADHDVTKWITVDNSIIQSGGHVFPCAVGIAIFHASDNRITHNDIGDLPYSGISVGWIWGYDPSDAKRNEVAYNHIHHLGWGVLSDMGGVYTLGPSAGTRIANNVIHDIYARTYGGWGLYTDEGSTGIVMENNLVYRCKSAGFHQHYGKDNVVRNNLFYRQYRHQLESTRIEEHTGFRFTNNIVYFSEGDLGGIRWDQTNFYADSNAYWDARGREITVGGLDFGTWQSRGKDIHSVITDPKFENPARMDFRINNRKLVKNIGFQPFDYHKAGVYGDDQWKAAAEINPERALEFRQMVDRLEALAIN